MLRIDGAARLPSLRERHVPWLSPPGEHRCGDGRDRRVAHRRGLQGLVATGEVLTGEVANAVDAVGQGADKVQRVVDESGVLEVLGSAARSTRRGGAPPRGAARAAAGAAAQGGEGGGAGAGGGGERAHGGQKGLAARAGTLKEEAEARLEEVATAEARARAIAQEAEDAALGAMAEAAEATRVAGEASRALEEAKASPDLR